MDIDATAHRLTDVDWLEAKRIEAHNTQLCYYNVEALHIHDALCIYRQPQPQARLQLRSARS